MAAKEVTAADFTLVDFQFIESHLYNNNSNEDELTIDFKPSGTYTKGGTTFDLVLDFKAHTSEDKLAIHCKVAGRYELSVPINSVEDLPAHFYANSIAILFPYLRAFVSTLTSLSSRNQHILLPTYNLTGLKKALQDNISEQE